VFFALSYIACPCYPYIESTDSMIHTLINLSIRNCNK